MGKTNNKKVRQAPIAELLEPRVLFSADSFSLLAGALLPDETSATPSVLGLITPESDTNTEAHNSASQSDPASVDDTDTGTDSVEIVFIDSRVPEYQSIIDDINANKSSSVTIVVIDQSESGIDVIRNTLSSTNNVDAVHLLSHSFGNGVRLGADLLSSATLPEFASSLSDWSHAFSEDADLLIYGCELGASQEGLNLMNEIAVLTGADVAISSDHTGHVSQGGDWLLEHSSGQIETAALVSASLQNDWTQTLATWNATTRVLEVSYTQDQFINDTSSITVLIADAADNGREVSLREAISAANNDPDPSNITIVLSGNSQYVLSIPDASGNEDDNLTGDLDIKHNLTIEGAGSELVTGTNIHADTTLGSIQMRVLDTHSMILNLTGLSISGGLTAESGGGLRLFDSIANITDVTFDTNEALGEHGGGLFSNNSEVNIVNSIFNNNTANKDGGGAYVNVGPVASFLNVGFTGNTAIEGGGGLHINSAGIIENSHFTGNNARDGAGLTVHDSGDVTAIHTDILDNTASRWGGGIWVQGSLSLTAYSTLNGNTASEYGGGGWVYSGALDVQTSTIFDNTVLNRDGGGLYIENGSLNMNDSIVRKNHADSGNGGGIHVYNSTATINNSTIAFNTAINGAGVYYESSSPSTIENTTLFKNVASEDGGAILVDSAQLYVRNSTIAENTAEDTSGAIDVDGGGATATLYNSIVSNNISNNIGALPGSGHYQLAAGVLSDGYNVVTRDPREQETRFKNEAQISDIIQIDTSTYVVDADLSGSLERFNGSYAMHLKLGLNSDAIDAGAGSPRLDGYGVMSNEFVDAGAVEAHVSSPANKLFWIDKDDHSVYRMNENGRALQQIRPPAVVNISGTDFPQEYLDIVYDGKTQQLFLIRHTPTSGNYAVAYADKDGVEIENTTLYLSGTAMVGTEHSTTTQYESFALAIEETNDPAAPNRLFISLREIGNNNYSLVAYDIVPGIDTATNTSNVWLGGFTDETPMVPTSPPAPDIAHEYDKVTTLDVVSDPNSAGDVIIAWGDSGNNASHHFVTNKPGALTHNSLTITYTDGGGNEVTMPSEHVRGAAQDAGGDYSYFATKHNIFRYEFVNWNLSGDLVRNGATEFSDIVFDSTNERLWFVDAGDGSGASGVIGYADKDLTAFGPEIAVEQAPYSITLASLSAVNTPPRVATNNALTVIENDLNKVIDDTLLEYEDTSVTGATDPVEIRYTVTLLPEHGTLYVDGSPILQSTPLPPNGHFTQADINSGKLTYSHNGDEVATDSFSFTVTDGDAGTVDDSKTFNITVLPFNDAPEITLNAQNLTVLESDTGVTFGTVSVADPDSPPPNITITDTNGDPHPYVELVGNDIVQKTGVNFDYETVPTFDFVITALDDQAAMDTQTFTVTVTDVNEAPIHDASNPVIGIKLENQTGLLEGSLGNPLPGLTATDPENDTLTYAIIDDGGYPGVFGLNASNQITVLTPLDFESTTNPIVIKIAVSDGTLKDIHTISISITDENEAPVIVAGASTAEIRENDFGALEDGTGAAMQGIIATDQDPADTLNYSIKQDSAEAALFSLNVAGQLELPSMNAFDFESLPLNPIPVTIEVSDGTNITEHVVMVTITDENEAPVIVAGASTAQIVENSTGIVHDASNVPMVAINAIDEETPAANLTYTLLNTGAMSTNFSLVNNQIQLDQPLDFESITGPIGLIVEVSDGVNNTQHQINITITDENEAPVIVTGDTTAQLAENSSGVLKDVLGNDMMGVSASDQDTADTLTYAIKQDSPEAALFNLNAAGQLELPAGNEFDSDTLALNPIPVTIEVSDGTNITEHVIMVTITDENEAPVVVTGDTTAQLAENNFGVLKDGLGNDMVGVSATDQDSADTLTYAIKQDSPEAALFNLNAAGQLELPAGNEFDFDTLALNPIPVTIEVNDGTNITEHVVMVTITDENEAPVIVASAATAQIAENSNGILADTSGADMIGINAIDQDAGDALTYSVMADSAEASRFSLNANGQLELGQGNEFDFEELSLNPIPVTIEVSDGTTSIEHLVNVTITDDNEAPKINNPINSLQAEELVPYAYTIPEDTFIDEDANTNLSIQVAMADGSSLPAWLNFDAATNTLSGTPTDADATDDLELIIWATDNADIPAVSSAMPVTLSISNVNQAPSDIVLSTADGTFNVVEDTAGLEIGTLSTTDADASDATASSHTYSFVNSADAERYEIVDNVLKLREGQEFDYESESPPSVSIDIRSSDDESDPDSFVIKTFNLNIIDINEAPQIQSVPNNIEIGTDQTLDLSQIDFIDPEGDPLTITVTQSSGEALPDWLAFDSESNVISVVGTPTNINGINLLILANDGKGGVTSAPLFVAIASAPEAPAAALPEPEPEPEVEFESEPEEAQPIVSETVVAETKPIENNSPVEEAAPELNENIAIDESKESVDLAALIKPLEKVSFVELDKPDNAITSINREIVVAQLEAIDNNASWLNLSEAFSQPSDIEFNELAHEFDRQREELEERAASTKTLIGSSFTLSSGISVGYLLWLIRGGTLMGSVLSSLPAWRLVDPLPVLGSLGDDLNDDDESLESMVDNDEQQPDSDQPPKQAA